MTNEINKTNPGRIEVIHDSDTIIDIYVHILHNARSRWDYFADVRSLSVVPLAFEAIKKTLLEAKARTTRLRFITEIRKENISYAKDFMEIVELRHLDGVKGNFGVSDSEYIAISTTDASLSEKWLTTIPHAVYSNVIEDIQQQYVFEILWNKATPAEQKIREIEDGIKPSETKVLENPDEIFNHMMYVIGNARKRLICSPSGAMQMVYDNFFDLYKKILDKHRSGEGEGIRWLTVIDKENKDIVEVFLDAGVKVRHVSNLPPINFAVDDTNFHATIEKMKGGKIMESLLSSNEPKYVNYYTSLFEGLWNNGINAETRIKDIEEGTDSANIEIIQNSYEALKRSSNLVRNANEEVLFMFSTPNTLRRQLQVQSLLQFDETTREHPFVKIKILVPSDGQIQETIEELRVEYPQVDFRIYEQGLNSRITIVLVDKRECMIIEVKDDTKEDSYTAVGLSVYSNSKSIVVSYASIFESLWRQTELYEQLKIHDKMQKEFINITAHELRTPVQSLLVLTEVLYSKVKDIEEHKLLDSTIKSAKRLHRLSNDILDVTRIESKSLELNKERFNLKDVILGVMTDMKSQIVNNKVELSSYKSTQDIFVDADKERIIQVISNLLNNAIKFTEEGNIFVSAEIKDHGYVFVTVKDTGQGIHPDILPRLFSKFASKSFQGTGLGLFISKSIVKAHGGKMWAENNPDGRGATFTFSLPTNQEP